MSSNERTGLIEATDRSGGGVKATVRRFDELPALSGRVYEYTGTHHPFSLCERIYGMDEVLLEQLRLAGFVVVVRPAGR